MSEREHIVELKNDLEVVGKLLETMRAAEGYCRSLAIMRADPRWTSAAGFLGKLNDRLTDMAMRARGN